MMFTIDDDKLRSGYDDHVTREEPWWVAGEPGELN